ncbi:carboxypeptidase-like regulatory domain-containing protein, partial [Daejeonella sp.]|uniref:SusC/RagA family TonB-linked outer membrane protein n=1 Tax=Daejeonella sp. TaxID=2805397 RepID=UPI0030BAB33B
MQLRLAFVIVLTTSIQLFSAPPVKSQAIEKQTTFQFMYRFADVKDIKKLEISEERMSVADILKKLLSNTSLDFKQVDNRIMIVNNLKSEDDVNVNKITGNPASKLMDIIVRGQVKDARGETLPGVSVKVKGTTAGASTDMDGRFSLNVDENAVLVFTYIGYVTKEVSVSNQTSLTVVLETATASLSEVVVTALGISRESKSLTYSTQQVKTEELTQAREPNVINSLQGKVAGLSINSSGTGVGSASRVVLRGNRSISSDNQVLYVIDGVPVRGFPDNLNSDNIASINVLKGPNSAALYGSQGQNGAIVIETKQGVAGKVNVSFNNTYMLNEAVDSTPYQSIYGQGSGGVYIKSSEDSWGPKMEGQSVATWSINPANAGQTYAFTNQPDARKDLYHIGGNLASNLIASIGGEKTQTVFSYTLTDASGIIPNNQLQRHNIALRMTNKLSSKLTLDSKLDYMRQTLNNQLAEGESSFNPNRQILTMPANIQTSMVSNFEFVDAQGYTRQDYWLPGTTVGSNPYWAMERNLKNNTGSRIIAMTSLAYKFSDAIKVMARGSFDGDNFVDTEKSYFGTYRDPAGRFQVGESSGNQ